MDDKELVDIAATEIWNAWKCFRLGLNSSRSFFQLLDTAKNLRDNGRGLDVSKLTRTIDRVSSALEKYSSDNHTRELAKGSAIRALEVRPDAAGWRKRSRLPRRSPDRRH